MGQVEGQFRVKYFFLDFPSHSFFSGDDIDISPWPGNGEVAGSRLNRKRGTRTYQYYRIYIFSVVY